MSHRSISHLSNYCERKVSRRSFSWECRMWSLHTPKKKDCGHWVVCLHLRVLFYWQSFSTVLAGKTSKHILNAYCARKILVRQRSTFILIHIFFFSSRDDANVIAFVLLFNASRTGFHATTLWLFLLSSPCGLWCLSKVFWESPDSTSFFCFLNLLHTLMSHTSYNDRQKPKNLANKNKQEIKVKCVSQLLIFAFFFA